MENSSDKNGKLGDLLIDGQFVYMGVVTLVNVKVLTSTHSYTFFSFFFSIGSVFTYLLFFWVLNLFVENDLFALFSKVFFHSSFYFALLFCSICLVMVDIGINMAHLEISSMIEKRDKLMERKIKIMRS